MRRLLAQFGLIIAGGGVAHLVLFLRPRDVDVLLFSGSVLLFAGLCLMFFEDEK